jgi:hypothetical protein
MALTIIADSGNYGALFTPQVYGKGQIKFLTGQIDFDNSYPTGGEDMDLTKYFKNLLGVLFESKSGYVFEYDYTAKKVKVMYFDYSNASDGVAVEVPDITNLSTLVDVRFIAWGY